MSLISSFIWDASFIIYKLPIGLDLFLDSLLCSIGLSHGTSVRCFYCRSWMVGYIYLTRLRPPHLLLRISLANPYFSESIWIKCLVKGIESKFVSILIMTVLSLFTDWGRMGRCLMVSGLALTKEYLFTFQVCHVSFRNVHGLPHFPHFLSYSFLSIFLSLCTWRSAFPLTSSLWV